jgi:hypothetical protein
VSGCVAYFLVVLLFGNWKHNPLQWFCAKHPDSARGWVKLKQRGAMHTELKMWLCPGARFLERVIGNQQTGYENRHGDDQVSD